MLPITSPQNCGLKGTWRAEFKVFSRDPEKKTDNISADLNKHTTIWRQRPAYEEGNKTEKSRQRLRIVETQPMVATHTVIIEEGNLLSNML